MKFQHLQSLITSRKTTFALRPEAPLKLATPRTKPYIEPNFQKEIFDVEKPSVILISAVGATGKSASAQVLATSAQLPLLDLSKHKAVGDSTISGLLTNSFEPQSLGGVFAGLADGTFALIIDGLDEGRSKTTEQAFEAFLDDIANLCLNSSGPSFVLLGRTAIVDTCWLYLESRGVRTGIVSIEPFDKAQAHEYIDRVTGQTAGGQNQQYIRARDAILDCLAGAFTDSAADTKGTFLSFIGYPPVLDAVATLLMEEKNFHRIESELTATITGDREVELLRRIAEFILVREQTDKVWQNILSGLVDTLKPEPVQLIRKNGFNVLEQCVRLLAYCMGEELTYPVFKDSVLDAKYEEQLRAFFSEHPFLTNQSFRNAVFEGFALATALQSRTLNFQQLALRYIDKFRATYHLVYMLSAQEGGSVFPLSCVRALIGGALDFRSRSSSVELSIDGSRPNEGALAGNPLVFVNVDISARIDDSTDTNPAKSRTFSFESVVDISESIELGGILADAFVQLPFDLILSSKKEIELIAPVSIISRRISFNAQSLAITASPKNENNMVAIEATELESSLLQISLTGGSLSFKIENSDAIGFPIVSYLDKSPAVCTDPMFKDKYLRLRKLLTHFRSHSKGRMAKYADKVENERVAGNQIGSTILAKLLSDGVLVKEGSFYFLEPDRINECLGVSWPDLRSGKLTEKLVVYLASINT